ncbi:MAG: hypothetical protein P8Q14_05955 [Vicingaceae bacterium]|nr:hypothetical protein [Vicingaceae bacterium]
MRYTTLLFIAVLFFSCKDSSKINKKEGDNIKTINSKTTTCQLIEKEFVNKIGKDNGVKELYLRCSIQDYFIKICESDVTANQLKLYLNKGIEVEMEIKDGLYDQCETSLSNVQSRMGTYIIIKKIIE